MIHEEEMNIDEIRKYLPKIRPLFRQASKKEKGRLLDEMEAITKLHRKHLIRLITGKLARRKRKKVRGRVYGVESTRKTQKAPANPRPATIDPTRNSQCVLVIGFHE